MLNPSSSGASEHEEATILDTRKRDQVGTIYTKCAEIVLKITGMRSKEVKNALATSVKKLIKR